MSLFDSEPFERDHLVFAREPNLDLERPRSQGRPPPMPPPANPQAHVQNLVHEMEQAMDTTATARARNGVDPGRLRVLEFTSLNSDTRQILEERLNAHVVDERRIEADGRQLIQLLVQFPTDAEIQTFQGEIHLLADGDTAGGVLPSGVRRGHYYGLQRLERESARRD